MKQISALALMVFILVVAGSGSILAQEPGAEAADGAEASDVGVVDKDAAAAGEVGEAQYDVRIKEMEERVDDLKEKIFRTKTRLMLLEETMLGGVIGGAKLVLKHRNDIGGWFKLESVTYYLDGNLIYRKSDVGGDLDSQKQIEIFDNPITSSTHLVSVYMVYRGNSGLFSYIEGLQVKLKSSHTFVAKEGKICYVDVIGYDRGGSFVQLKDRPAITYKVKYTDLTEKESDQIQVQQEATGQ